MKIKSMITGTLAGVMAFGSIAVAQNANIGASKEATPESWFNGSAMKIELRHGGNVDVEGARASDIDFQLRPKFYQPVFNNNLMLQVRTNISLRQGANLEAPVPQFLLYKEFKFADESITVTPTGLISTPLNGEESTGSLIVETFAQQALEYDHLTVSPYLYNFSAVNLSGKSNVDAKVYKKTAGQGATAKPTFEPLDRTESFTNTNQDFGVAITTEVGTTFTPLATKGFSFDLAFDLTGKRSTEYAAMEGKINEDLSKASFTWTTKPTLRLTYKINDNISIENTIQHELKKFGGKSIQSENFSNFAVLSMKLY